MANYEELMKLIAVAERANRLTQEEVDALVEKTKQEMQQLKAFDPFPKDMDFSGDMPKSPLREREEPAAGIPWPIPHRHKPVRSNEILSQKDIDTYDSISKS